jgi:hypothetical protein
MPTAAALCRTSPGLSSEAHDRSGAVDDRRRHRRRPPLPLGRNPLSATDACPAHHTTTHPRSTVTTSIALPPHRQLLAFLGRREVSSPGA